MTLEDMTSAAPAVLGLDAVDAGGTDLVGGKAMNLAEMARAGFPVPGGFCVTTAAYRDSLPADPVFDELETCSTESSRLADLAKYVRELILETPIPEHVVAEVRRSYGELTGATPAVVAVRSSATAEDLPDASFAGQYDTYLNVTGLDDVLAAVRKCWASLWSERAALYRAGHDVDRRGPAIAVVVQHMVDAARAGVLYTANPVSGDRTETLLEATPGLGEAVVSGTVTPDHYRIAADGAVLEGAGTGCLAPEQLSTLQTLGSSLAEHFTVPQDVEWAIDTAGEIRVTQSRPITTLFPIPTARAKEPRAYWSVNVYQGISQPFTPMGSYMIRQRQKGMSQYMVGIGFSPEISDVHGWLYWDITTGVRSPDLRPKMAAFIDSLAAPSGQVVEQLGSDARFPVADGGSTAVAQPRRRRWERMIPALLWPSAARKRVARDASDRLRGFVGPAAATADQRLRFVESVHRDVCQIEANLPRDANTAGSIAPQYAAKLLGGVVEQAELATVYRGVPHNPTTDMDLELWRLAVRLRRDPDAYRTLVDTEPEELAQRQLIGALPPIVQNGVDDFLETYGCRATAEIDFGVSRWSDDPTPVLLMLTNFVRADGGDQDAEQRFATAAAAAEQKIDELVGRLPARRAPQAWLARFLLRRSRQLRGLREFPKLCLMRGFALLRAQLLRIGEDLVATGRLTRADDVMFLDLPEVRAVLEGQDLRQLVTERRAVYAGESRRPSVPSIILSDGTVPRPDTAVGAGSVLSGMAAAVGVVTGTAKVVSAPDDAQVQPGEILVASSTDPGWTPLFLTAAALVTETGGMISHGTTVARECGIPAVVGVSEATQRIRTGQRITVDGSSGTISIDEPAVGDMPEGR